MRCTKLTENRGEIEDQLESLAKPNELTAKMMQRQKQWNAFRTYARAVPKAKEMVDNEEQKPEEE